MSIENIINLSLRGVESESLRQAFREIAFSRKMGNLLHLPKVPEKRYAIIEHYLGAQVRKKTASIINNSLRGKDHEQYGPDFLVKIGQSYQTLNQNLSYFGFIDEIAMDINASIEEGKAPIDTPLHRIYSVIIRALLEAYEKYNIHIVSFEERGYDQKCNIAASASVYYIDGEKRWEMMSPPYCFWEGLLMKVKAEAGMRLIPAKEETEGIIRGEYKNKPYAFFVRASPDKKNEIITLTRILTPNEARKAG